MTSDKRLESPAVAVESGGSWVLLAEMVTGMTTVYLLAGRAALSNSDWGGIDERKEGVDCKGSRGKSLEGQDLEGGCWDCM